MNTSKKTVIRLTSAVIVIALVALILSRPDLRTTLLSILQQVENAGIPGHLLFVALVCLCVIALVPSIILTLGAGALYGVIEGSLTMVFAQTLGATMTFLLARYFLHQRVTDLLTHRARLQRVMAIVRPHDWKMVALFRMIPFFPYKISNYVFGVTHLALAPYVLGTLIGLWPMTVFNVYLGSLAVDLLTLEANGVSRSPWQWGFWIAGLVFTGAVVAALVRRATTVLRENAELPGKGY